MFFDNVVQYSLFSLQQTAITFIQPLVDSFEIRNRYHPVLTYPSLKHCIIFFIYEQ